MSKRSRRPRSEHEPVNNPVRPVNQFVDEPKLNLGGEAFQQFDSWLDRELEKLVDRWIGVAAPDASALRRYIFLNSRRHSGQASSGE